MNRRDFLQQSLGGTVAMGTGLVSAGMAAGSEPAQSPLSSGQKNQPLEEVYCCNVAGYIGDKHAAPILLDMLQREEGFAGGYYTGIATIADGKLHYAKVIGDVAALRTQTDARQLPGHVGIIHSRSKSGGDLEWGHPFVDCKEQMAYLANGSDGYFDDKRDKNAIAGKLATEGHTFRSHASKPIGRYPVLPNGTCVHTSEVMCHLIESLVTPNRGPAEAMRQAFMTFPAEIVGLMVHSATPDRIIASRINQPLMIARDSEATYLATTALAFPKGAAQWCSPMPTNATAAIYRDRIEILPFDPPTACLRSCAPPNPSGQKTWSRRTTCWSTRSSAHSTRKGGSASRTFKPKACSTAPPSRGNACHSCRNDPEYDRMPCHTSRYHKESACFH